MGRLAGLVVLAAIFTFCLVQDAETSAGVGRYLTAQRAAMAGRGPRVTVDEIMRPANRLAVREGMAWSPLRYARFHWQPNQSTTPPRPAHDCPPEGGHDCPAKAGHYIDRSANAGHYNEGPSWMT